MTALVSGTAGFIGYHVAEALLARGDDVIGIDNINDYYDVRLKQARLARLEDKPGFRFRRADIADRDVIHDLVRKEPGIDVIVHLAAQAGVRYSLVDPYAYVHSNVMGHLVMLEAARLAPRLRHFVYASSSSVYGANSTLPFSETDRVETPLSMYAATKLADEMMSHAYGHLHALPQTGLRFFTVYGPWGRPDMAYYSFARAIMAGEPITLYEGGTLRRDFTYIDDIVAGVVGCLDHPPDRTPPARVLNIGNHRSELVSTLVELLETSLGRRAVIREVPRPLSDVPETFASVAAISALTGFAPRTTLAEGIPRFVAWFKAWNGHPQEV
ncbi:MAG TPA: NAD-dependent epimerase/dehydratase family protein [Acetobacteraceae bacterium]|nr:NAD-dependent epimerase/dehydratase family protein [Acetobacteraceae bacterium]